MTAEEVLKKYKSDSERLKKLSQCNYCPFEEILRGNYAKAGVLKRQIRKPNEKHPHRRTIEEVCGRDIDEPCDMKYAINRTDLDDYNLAQLKAQITFRNDLGKYFHNEIDRNDAGINWTKRREALVDSKGRSNISYAERYREIWNMSLCTNGRHSLTEIGLYRIVMSSNEEYLEITKALDILSKRERVRHIHGVNPDNKD